MPHFSSFQVRERKFQRSVSSQEQPLSGREQMLNTIRAKPSLRPTVIGQQRLQEATSRLRVAKQPISNDASGCGAQSIDSPAKKVIKPELSFELNSFSVSFYFTQDNLLNFVEFFLLS